MRLTRLRVAGEEAVDPATVVTGGDWWRSLADKR